MCLLGFNAGWFLSFGTLAGLVVAGEFAAAGNSAAAKIVFGLLFPIGLVLIVLAGSELLSVENKQHNQPDVSQQPGVPSA